MKMVQYVLDSIATQPIVIHVKENRCLVFIQTAPFVVLIPFKNRKNLFRMDNVWASSICIGQIAVQLFSSNHRISASQGVK